ICFVLVIIFFFQAEDGIRDFHVTGVQTCALPIFYLVVIGALIFAAFIAVTGLADAIGNLIVGLGLGPVATMALVAVFLLLIGSVLDGLALMLLTTPILLPLVTGMGLSPIWFGIFLVRAMEIGFIHPPMGMNLYVIQRVVPDVSLGRIFKGVLP